MAIRTRTLPLLGRLGSELFSSLQDKSNTIVVIKNIFIQKKFQFKLVQF